MLVLYGPLSGLSYIPVSVGLGEQVGLTGSQVGLTVGAHALAAAVAGLLLGPLLDVVPVRRVLPAAVVVNGLASLALCLSPAYGLLLAGRLVTGAASAAVTLCAYVVVSDAARDDDVRRDRTLSLLQGFMSVGAASALALGAAAAAAGRPRWVFVVLAAYSLAMLVVALRPARTRGAAVRPGLRGGRAPLPAADPVATPVPALVALRTGLARTVREVGGLVRQRRVLALMAGSLVLGLVISGSHFGVSLLLEGRPGGVPALERVVLSVLIPVGVFSGAALTRQLLRRRTREALYQGLYLLLPLPVIAYAAATAYAGTLVQAVCLLLVGALLGAMMPLSTALGIGWFPDLRGSATAAESTARGAGATLGPVAVGAAAVAWSDPGAALVVAAVAVLGLVASRGVRSRRVAVAPA
ncbi:MFS transporter [uncultured Pseudokineococcus sp.]|uniref:MFS transporter n=1 Tax=uncultured Pseudokineococcus sp. TaxID=1642928 RepID=UPI00261FD6BE|nr:MFS transporter [uncultured Pseudokineococcus sp.]